MVKTSFQKLKNHLASFDKVVKVRTTPDVITEGSWGFEHTKAVFMKEVIPFIKTLRELFNDFDNGLNLELNENFFLDNDRLLEHIICQDVMNIVMHADSVSVNVLHSNNKCRVHDNLEIEQVEQENDNLFKLLLSQDIVNICVNSLATHNNYLEMQQSFIDAYNENLVLKAELAKKEHMVEKNFFNEVELSIKINEWQAKLNAKDVLIANLRKHIENLKGKNVVEKDVQSNNTKVIALGMFKLDLEPLSPIVLKNKDAHIDYIKHTQENADILQELVEQARALRPLDKIAKIMGYDLEVALRKHTFYILDLEGVDLLKGSRGSNLYTLSLEDMMLSSPICLLSKSSKTNLGYGFEVAIACYTQNRSLICKRNNKTSYELLYDRKPKLSYLYVFGALCYPTNDSEDLGKLKPKADIGIFIGYALARRLTDSTTSDPLIIETIHVDFDEIQAMASE
ncbi:integrase, catalytic region, zinc finger, CCHC-type containing protein [Tanacetum coccineum]